MTTLIAFLIKGSPPEGRILYLAYSFYSSVVLLRNSIFLTLEFNTSETQIHYLVYTFGGTQFHDYYYFLKSDMNMNSIKNQDLD